jgi:hypothetical protein
MKARQAEKLFKARKDPTLEKIMSVRQLSVQQSASQLKLRKAVQVRNAITR